MFDENNNITPQENEETRPVVEAQPAEPVNIDLLYQDLYSVPTEAQIQKNKIKRTAFTIGLACLALSLIRYGWSYVYLFFTVDVMGMSRYDAVMATTNPVFQQVMQIVISCAMFFIPFTLAVKCMGKRIDKTVDFGPVNKGTFLPYILFGVGFCAFANIATAEFKSFFDQFGVKYEQVNYGENPSGIFGFLLSLIATAVVPALAEEFACRGIILGLLKKYGEGFAVVASSVLFGIMHGNFEQIPFATMVGLVLGYIYVKTKSLWSCVLVHFINNAISVTSGYLTGLIGVKAESLLYIVYLVMVLMLAIWGTFLLAKRGKEQYSLAAADTTEIKTVQKYKWFFMSVPVLIFCVYNLVAALRYFEFFEKIIQFLDQYIKIF